MERIGGINFNPKICGGYRPRADSIVKIEEEDLIRAMREGFQFVENRFSSLVFDVGKWNQGKMYWNGNIPLKFLSLEKQATE